jgi:Transglycosylase SLT domain
MFHYHNKWNQPKIFTFIVLVVSSTLTITYSLSINVNANNSNQLLSLTTNSQSQNIDNQELINDKINFQTVISSTSSLVSPTTIKSLDQIKTSSTISSQLIVQTNIPLKEPKVVEIPSPAVIQPEVQSIPVVQPVAEVQEVYKPIVPEVKIVPQGKVLSGEELSILINAKCIEFGCNPEQLLRVMYCESGGRNVVGSGTYIGIFQFLPSTFNANAKRVGIMNADIWNMEHQVIVATWMFSKGQAGQWGCK